MTDHLLSIEMNTMMICKLAGGQLPLALLQALLAVSPQDQKAAINLLVDRNWLVWNEDQTVAPGSEIPQRVLKAVDSMPSKTEASEMIDRINELDLVDQVPARVIGHLYQIAGRENEGAALLFVSATGEQQRHQPRVAVSQYQECIRLLEGRLEDREVSELFLNASLQLSDLCNFLRMNFNNNFRIRDEAEEVALRLGDQRRLAMLHFHRGRTTMLSHRLHNAIQEMEKGFAVVAELGDEDMVAQSSRFRAYYYYSQGLCRETADNAELAMTMVSDSTHVPEPNIPIMLAMSSFYLGNLSHAVGVLESNWNQVQKESGNDWSMIVSQALLGQVLLMCGKKDAALTHLREAEGVARNIDDALGLFWARRALAYHYFVSGQYHDAYQTMDQCVNDSRRSGMGKVFYGMPWLLDMLAQFHRMGFQPLPGCEYSAEMEDSLNGPNILLRGVAHRIRATENRAKGVPLKEVRALLLRSEYELGRSGAAFELAKTRAELALVELAAKEENTARQLALKAWDGWSEFNTSEFPGELKALIGSQYFQDTDPFSAKKLLGRYMDMTQALIAQHGPDEIYFQLLNATCKFFDAERGGIFSLENMAQGGPAILLKGLNITEAQTRENSFQTNLKIIQRASANWKPIVTRLPNLGPESICRVLCLPIRVGGGGRVVLYYDRRYILRSSEPFDESMLRQVTYYLERFTLRTLENIERSEEKTKTSLWELTKGKNRLDDVPMFWGPAFRDLIDRMGQVASSDASVLILGETGVGKGVLARNIHDLSHRQNGPFVSVDLSSIPENLIESELFGHEKGAFTGADRQKQGLMELANKGTLFIDEIGEIPKAVQVKLLRAIEERAFNRVGGIVKRTVDFRLIVATNRDLVKEVEEGNFREDLYYRLCVVPFIVPPLRERGDDVVKLAEKFLAHYSRKYHRAVPTLSPEQKAMLKAYHWPGNIRELRNVIERSTILSDSSRLDLAIVPMSKKTTKPVDPASSLPSDRPTLDEMQRRYILEVLKETSGKLSGPSGAAAILGLKRTTLHHRMKKLQIKI